MPNAVDLVVTDARVVLPGGETVKGWLAVAEGKVIGVGESGAPNARERLNAKGLLTLPGLVDLHVHFRDPDFTEKEDFPSGSMAAAFGGVTTVVDMPNDDTPMVRPADVRKKIAYLRGRSYVDFGLYAELRDSSRFVAELRDLGVVGLKWYMGYEFGESGNVVSRAAIRRAMQAAGSCNLLVGVHAESAAWIESLEGELRKVGDHRARAHQASRPPFVEAIGVFEAALVAGDVGCDLHIHHLSSQLGLQAATAMRLQHSKSLTIETCPHYLFLDDGDVEDLGPRSRVNPPIRSSADRESMWRALKSGGIDVVASDHAPHLPSQKLVASVWDANSGLIGVETLFPLLFTRVVEGELSLSRFLEIAAERPASIARLATKGRLLPGSDADFLLVDPEARGRINSANLHSKHPLTPYPNWQVAGLIRSVYLKGRAVVENGELVGGREGSYVRALAT